MDGFRPDLWGDMTRLPSEQRRLVEIEAAWRWYDCRVRRNGDDRTAENRDRLAEAQNWRCCYCGVRTTASGGCRATFEHIIPRALGGSNLVGNLAISCCSCNNKCGMRMYPEHIEVLAILGEAWMQNGRPGEIASDFYGARIDQAQAPDRAVPVPSQHEP